MTQLEHEYTGADFTASVKAINASVLEGGVTGIFIGHYLQSVTPKLALGLETVWQRVGLTQPPDANVSYVARYKSQDWVASAQLQTMGALNATFWKRLSERVQAGVDMTISLVPSSGALMGGPQKEGITTFGAKYDFRMSTFRAQIDTSGKLSCLLEKRVAAPVTMSFAAEVDHLTVSTSTSSSPAKMLIAHHSNKQRSEWASNLRLAERSFRTSKRLSGPRRVPTFLSEYTGFYYNSPHGKCPTPLPSQPRIPIMLEPARQLHER